MNERFDMTRLFNLLRGDLLNRYRFVLTASAAIAGLMIVHAVVFQPLEVDRTVVYWSVLGIMLLVVGPIYASQSFRELHDKTRNEAYLLLPASAFEKVLSRLLLATVLFAAYSFVLVTISAWLIVGIKELLFARREVMFMPVSEISASAVGLYVVNQSIYLLGGAWFRKQHFTKTVLTVTAAFIALIVLVGVLVRIFFPEVADGYANLDIEPGALFRQYEAALASLLEILKWLVFVGIPVFCWGVTWMRVKETQVSDGV